MQSRRGKSSLSGQLPDREFADNVSKLGNPRVAVARGGHNTIWSRPRELMHGNAWEHSLPIPSYSSEISREAKHRIFSLLIRCNTSKIDAVRRQHAGNRSSGRSDSSIRTRSRAEFARVNASAQEIYSLVVSPRGLGPSPKLYERPKRPVFRNRASRCIAAQETHAERGGRRQFLVPGCSSSRHERGRGMAKVVSARLSRPRVRRAPVLRVDKD